MNWFLSILIGLLTGAVGLVSVGYLATLNVRWYRISSFEGGSGYYVVMLALLGGIAGLIVGIVCSRIVAGWAHPGFLKGLGVAWGSMVTLVFVIGVFCRLGADLAPTIDGKDLELAIEVRAPQGFVMPLETDAAKPFASVYLPGGRHQPPGVLRLDEATQVDGRWVIPGTVPLDTSASTKYLRVFLNKRHDGTYSLPLRSRPNEPDFAWSKWIESGWNVGTARPAPEDAFFMRFKVQVIEPPPPPLTQAEYRARDAAAEQARFEALPPDAPLLTWLDFARYGAPPERIAAVNAHLASRENFVAELSALMLGDDHEVAARATRWIENLELFSPDLLPAVAAAGRKIADMIRAFAATSPADDLSHQAAADVSVRFSAWMVAVRALRKHADGDFTPELQEILVLARQRPDSQSLRRDVVRVASYYLKEWAGVEPLPTDPPPR